MDSASSAHQDREDLIAEVTKLRHVIADMQMTIDERQMDNMHAFQEGGEEERRRVVAWLRANTCGCHDFAGDIERGEHRREEEE
jgi:hypothetical protein